MALTSIRTNGDDIEIVDQLLLPHTVAWVAIKSPDDAYTAIKSMMIRGAPAIASLAALSVSSYLSRALEEEPRPAFLTSYQLLEDHLSPILAHLYASRPTAVNLGAAITRLQGVLAAGRAEARKGPTDEQTSLAITVKNLIAEGRAVADEDVGRNKIMGQLGADWILRKAEENHQDITEGLNILTVCNTGSLATSVSKPHSEQTGVARTGWWCLELSSGLVLLLPQPRVTVLNPGIWNRSWNHHSTPRNGQAQAGILHSVDAVSPRVKANRARA